MVTEQEFRANFFRAAGTIFSERVWRERLCIAAEDGNAEANCA
jgi:hypothetical protein